jgi:hypothetical protein
MFVSLPPASSVVGMRGRGGGEGGGGGAGGDFPSSTTPRLHEGDQQRAMGLWLMAAVVYLVLGFLLLVSEHNEVAMSCRHKRRPGGPIKYLRYISH